MKTMSLNFILNCAKISRGFISYNKNFSNLFQYNPNLYMMTNLQTNFEFNSNDIVNINTQVPVVEEEITTEMKGRNSKAPKRVSL